MEPVGIPAPQIALKHLRQVVSLYRIWRTKLLDLTSQVAIFHFLLLHPLQPPDNYWSPSGDDVSVSFSFGNGWVDRCNTLKEQLYRSLENVPAAANTNGQTKISSHRLGWRRCLCHNNKEGFCFSQEVLHSQLLDLSRFIYRGQCLDDLRPSGDE